jgi:hypothetical protein
VVGRRTKRMYYENFRQVFRELNVCISIFAKILYIVYSINKLYYIIFFLKIYKNILKIPNPQNRKQKILLTSFLLVLFAPKMRFKGLGYKLTLKSF